jgi:hypothetical protein
MPCAANGFSQLKALSIRRGVPSATADRRGEVGHSPDAAGQGLAGRGHEMRRRLRLVGFG